MGGCAWFESLHGVCPAGAALGLFLSVLLGALLQLGDVLVRGAVGLDGLLAVRGELWLPVALARLLLGERVLLVLLVVLDVCARGECVSEILLCMESRDEGEWVSEEGADLLRTPLCG